MPVTSKEFSKMKERHVYGFKCLCGAIVITGIKPRLMRCWKCHRTWKVTAGRMVMLVGSMRSQKCPILPNYTTNKYGQCKRKALCSLQGRECEAIDEFTLPIVAIR